MISVEAATQIILETPLDLGDELIGIENATGRILAEDIFADRDFPPFDRVTMDGIAIQFKRSENGQKKFKIEKMAAAGAIQTVLEKEENCIEVMTGSMLPQNTDTVIRYEDLEVGDGWATIFVESIKPGQNIHRKGQDQKQASKIISKGRKISPAEIGVCATVGKSKFLVKKLPQIAIISNGDELVEIEESPLPYQIRKSNSWTIASILSQNQIGFNFFHLPDDAAIISHKLQEILKSHDVLILSGGVSMGQLDFLPKVLNALGIKELFHKVSLRPGKPFWFGSKTGEKVVFAFPGNPVSAFLGTVRFFLPWYEKTFFFKDFQPKKIILKTDFEFKPDLTYFLQVKTELVPNKNILQAIPVPGNGSGDLVNLVNADGFVELPKGRVSFPAGAQFDYFNFR